MGSKLTEVNFAHVSKLLLWLFISSVVLGYI